MSLETSWTWNHLTELQRKALTDFATMDLTDKNMARFATEFERAFPEEPFTEQDFLDYVAAMKAKEEKDE